MILLIISSLLAAFMKNYIKWEAKNSEPCLIVDVNLRVTLEVKKKLRNTSMVLMWNCLSLI